MDFHDIKSLFVPILMIGFGLFIKTKKNEYYQSVKRWWKLIVAIGTILLILRILLILDLI